MRQMNLSLTQMVNRSPSSGSAVREVRVVYEETGAGNLVIYTVMKPRVRD